MCDHDDGLLLFVTSTAQQAQYLQTRFTVQIAGGFVSQHNQRVGDERTGDGDTLLLTAGKLIWLVVLPIAQAN